MNVRPIQSAVVGEHVLAVAPRMAFPIVDAGWLRHLRLFQGRALDATALTAEQDVRAGRLALVGQTLSPGVVTGLDVALEASPGGPVIAIGPGLGVLPSGEDVVLGRELRLRPGAFGAIDPALRAAVLVLVPVTTRIAGRFDPEDPCERDESEDAFADEQCVDGLRVELVPWQAAWSTPDASAAGRNQLAYAMFQVERDLPPGQLAPWQVGGLSIALVGLSAGAVVWIDRHAAARVGGHPPARSPLTGARPVGPPALWQARILQLVDHLADLRTSAGVLPSALAAKLDWLPPAGLVPRDAVELTAPLGNRFFPPSWRLIAAPLPREQLDAVLGRAAALAPLSTSVGQDVLILVPVPQAVFEPDLLVVEHVSPEFLTAIANLVAERTQWLGHRAHLRSCRNALAGAIDPQTVIAYPAIDPEALENEGAITEDATGEAGYDTQLAGTVRRSTAFDAFKARAAATGLVSDIDLDQRGLVGFIADVQDRIARANDAIDFGFLRSQSDIYRVRQLMLGNEVATKLATSPVLASIAKGDTATAVRSDLGTLFTKLRTPATTTPPPPPPASSPPVQPPPMLSPAAQPAVIARSAVVARTVAFEPSPSELRIATATRASTVLPTLALGPGGLSPTGEVIASSPRTLVGLPRTTLGGALDVAGVIVPPAIKSATTDDIRDSAAVIGATDFRNITVAQRIEPPASADARQYAIAGRFGSLQTLDSLQIKVDDLPVYGVPSTDASGQAGRINTTFGALKSGGGLDWVLHDPAPPRPVDGKAFEEADYFNDTVLVMEAHINTLRALEGRVAQYKSLVDDARGVLAQVQTSLASADARIAVIEHEVTDRRQAVATARALLAEEEVRVERVKARRAAVIAQHVQLLGYVRPRFFTGLTDAPTLALDPALLESPVPACLGGHDDAPPALAQMVALLREAPLAWLRLGPPILAQLDRVELLHSLVVTARTRTQQIASTGFASALVTAELAGRFGGSISAIGRAQIDAVWQQRAPAAELDLRNLVGLSWLESREVATRVASLGDLIEAASGRTAAASRAQAELTSIDQVAGCLWARVGAVAPAIRLAWAEALDQYGPDRLVTLTALPRWSDVPYADRKAIEALAEWLIGQIDRTITAAVAWIHELVRACILLASHSPIDQIIAGSVPVASPAGPGQLVPITIDPARVRVGMRVTFFQASAAVAHAVVEDVVGAQARARVATATSTSLRLDAGTSARFALAGSAVLPLTRELA
jgi:hypothetical protein